MSLATDVVLALSTAVLAVVTAFYAKYTKAQITPHLKASLSYEGSEYLTFVLQNTGKGAAHDVDAKWWVRRPGYEERSFEIGLLEPGERHEFAVPLGTVGRRITHVEKVKQELGSDNGVIEFQASCGGLTRPRKHFSQTISISAALNRIDDAEEFQAEDPLKTISGELRNVEEAIREIESGCDGEGET